MLIIIGASLAPLLSVQIKPSKKQQVLTVSYSWKNALPEIIEREVTTKIEGLAATLKGVKKINSSSSKGKGTIRVTFKKGTNLKLVKFQLSALIRSAYKKFPEGVNLPLIAEGWSSRTKSESIPLLYYTIIGNGNAQYIQSFSEDFFDDSISALEGVESISFFGSSPLEWELKYSKKILDEHEISIKDIEAAVRNYLRSSELGYVDQFLTNENKEHLYVELNGGADESDINWNRIPVKKVNDKVVYLGELAKAVYKEEERSSFSRVNGLNTTNMIVYAEQEVNQIELVKKIKAVVNNLQIKLPDGFSLIEQRDTTKELREEIDTIFIRIVASVALLLLFVLLVSRKWRYVTIILISLISNIAIAFIFYYLLDIEIHSYSLAGITVSLGILIDNSIIMLDHLRNKGNRKVFLAIVGATFTTIGALSVIIFLDDKAKANLLDFAFVIVINISVSLLIAYYFIPALLDKLPIKRLKAKVYFKRKRRVIRFTNFYYRIIYFFHRFKKLALMLTIIGCGLPVFLLPNYLEGEKFYIEWYNTIFGSETYEEDIKPIVDKALGGAARLFTELDFSQVREEEQGRTRLNVRIYMPDGATIIQTNEIARKLENFLSQFEELENYFTTIYDIENARLEILFKEAHEDDGFPEFLKEELISEAANIGGCDVSVSGVGNGFSNRTVDTQRSSSLQIKGYNYETVLTYANDLKQKLLQNPRIQKVVINTGKKRYRNKLRQQYVMTLDRELLTKNNSNIWGMLKDLRSQTTNDKSIMGFIYNDEYTKVKLIANESVTSDTWFIRNELFGGNKLKDVGQLSKQPSEGTIDKVNQEFKVNVEYDFIGSYSLGELILEEAVEGLNEKLPLGFKAKKNEDKRWNPKKKEQYWLVLLVILIIYMVCTILLESLRQPITIILMVPISFIGSILTFSIFDLKFDQGGYASLLLLCGLVVNAGLYIINDYNNIKKKYPNLSNIKGYLKAFNAKIIPICLTIISTVIGLLPFLIFDSDSQFWYALAAGTIGGLVFSLIAVYLYLPLFLFWRKKHIFIKPNRLKLRRRNG